MRTTVPLDGRFVFMFESSRFKKTKGDLMHHKVLPQGLLQSFFLALLILVAFGTSFGNDCTLPLFGAPWHFSNGATTVRTAIADFNNDGNLDIAATAHDAGFVGVFIGNGTGSFVRQTVLSAGNFDVPVAAGDFNNDGKQDLAVGSRDGTVWIFMGLGNGNFSSPNRYADGPGEAYEMAVADFNQDGKLDLAIGHQFAGLAIMIGNGNGGFSQSSTYLSGLGPVKVMTADFNNDGKADLITANQHSQSVSLLLGDGIGGFNVTTVISPSFNDSYSNSGFAVGDFNGDGNTDFATSGNGASLVVLYGNGHGAFPGSQTFVSAANNFPYATDLNGDGNLDIVAVSHTDSIGSIIFGNGTGGFSPSTSFAVGNGPQTLSVADLNNDGKQDLVTPNYYGGDITVSINNGLSTQDTSPPVISSAPNITTYANVPGGANVAYQVVAFDNSGVTPTLDCAIPSNSFFPVGTTGVMCAAVDSCGNRSANFSFTVNVTCGPVDLSPLADMQVAATGPSGAVVNYNSLSGVAGINFSIASGSTFPIGTTHVSYIVTELCGNTFGGSFNVTVVDEPPMLNLPNSIYSNATSSSGRTIYYTATASDPVSGNLSVNCTPPSGSTFAIGQTTVTCSATDSANQTTTQSFNIYVSGCIGCTLPDFAGGIQYGVGSIPGRIAINDLNRDGKVDMAVTSPDSSFVAVFLGTGNGSFGAPSYLSAGGFSVPVMSGEFNNDNNPDLAVGASDGTVWIYLGDGAGGFTGPTTFDDGPGEAYEMVIDDFDRDGSQDLAIGHQFAGLAVLFGDGTGGFSSPTFYIEDRGPVQVRKADFNNDGKLDLVTSNSAGGGSSILLGDGLGGFSTTTLDVPGYGIGVGDFNSDNKIDLVFQGSDGTSVGLYLGNGAGAFTYSSSYPTNGNFGDMEAADFNQDGNVDVAILGYDTISVLSGDGMGHFSSPLVLPTLSNPVDINVSDLNADGKPDISTADYYDGTVSVFLNLTVLQTAVTQTGSNVTVQTIGADLSFTNVTSAGVTSVTPIADPAIAGEIPGGFAISDSIAFEVSTTAAFNGPVNVCFNVTSVNDMTEFNNLRVLHKEGDLLVDRTSSHDFPNRKICATTTSFSPFYLATVDKQIQSLFDRSKAFKSGSTIPIKIKILNGGGQNVSSATMAVSVRGLRRIGNATASVVNDSGNANPDYTFRYDSGLQGYIYNLKTTGLAAGKYALSVYAGSDHSFFYTLAFDIR
jgi:hypothetical protein